MNFFQKRFFHETWVEMYSYIYFCKKQLQISIMDRRRVVFCKKVLKVRFIVIIGKSRRFFVNSVDPIVCLSIGKIQIEGQ